MVDGITVHGPYLLDSAHLTCLYALYFPCVPSSICLRERTGKVRLVRADSRTTDSCLFLAFVFSLSVWRTASDACHLYDPFAFLVHYIRCYPGMSFVDSAGSASQMQDYEYFFH